MSAFSERVEQEDEEDRIGLLRAREAYDRQNVQLSFPCIGTCQRCGAYWDTRYYEHCPSPCHGYIG